MRTNLYISISLVVILLTIGCQKDNEDNRKIDNLNEAKELVGEINYLVRKNFPSSFSSWQLNNESFNGRVSGTMTIDGSFSHSSRVGSSTFSTNDTYNDVYVVFTDYCDRSDYKLTVNGTFYLTGKISESGSIGGNSSSSGSHTLVGIFSVSGKFTGENMELYLINHNSLSFDYSAVLTTKDGEWVID